MIRKKKDVKAAVINATIELIIANGINQLTTAKIAERAGTAETVIYRHFNNKQDIITQMFFSIGRQVRTGLEAIAIEPLPALLRLEKLIEFHLSFMQKTKGISRLLFSEQIHLGNPELREMVKGYIEKYELMLIQIFHDGIRAGEFRDDLDLKMAAQSYIALIYFIMHKWSLDDFSWNLLNEKEHILHYWTNVWK